MSIESPARLDSHNDFIQTTPQNQRAEEGLENKILDLINILNQNKTETNNGMIAKMNPSNK